MNFQTEILKIKRQIFFLQRRTSGGGGGGTWGSITGTLSSQTDLQSALDAKESLSNKTDTMAGNTASSTKYLSAKGVYDWAVATFTTTAAVATQITTALTGYLTAATAASTYEPIFSVLPIAKGGTNSGAALNNNRLMKSSGGAIIEAAAITAAKLLKSDANGIPVATAYSETDIDQMATGNRLFLYYNFY